MNGAGRGALATDHPSAFFQTRGWALSHADVVLVLGTPLDFRLGYGRPPTFAEDAKVAMIDVDPAELGRNRALELGIAGDIDAILRQLTEGLGANLAARSAPWRAELRRREGEARAKLVELAATDQAPISHYRWAWEIACAVTRDTIVVGDGGDVVNCAAKFVPIDRMGQWMDPGPLGCLGVGPSFALTAKLLRPDQRVLLVSGDGAFGLNGMELETAVRFKLPFTCVIGNDGGWGQIRSPQVSFLGEGRTVATSLPTTRYDLMVEALGGRGAYVTDPSEIGPVLARALASDEVWCVNVVLDPEAYRKSGQVSMAI
jgi:acetolactate synthase-1/2/3 large subunit